MSGYDYEPETGGSNFLGLRSKGEMIHVRFVSTPARQRKHWIQGNKGNQAVNCADLRSIADRKANNGPNLCPYCGDRVMLKAERLKLAVAFGWKVLDRADQNRVKMFTSYAEKSVYEVLQDLSRNPQAGDPQKYDVQITRTEGNPYYTVLALLQNNVPLTPEEIAAVQASDIDLVAELIKENSGAGGGNANLETAAPVAPVTPAVQPAVAQQPAVPPAPAVSTTVAPSPSPAQAAPSAGEANPVLF